MDSYAPATNEMVRAVRRLAEVMPAGLYEEIFELWDAALEEINVQNDLTDRMAELLFRSSTLCCSTGALRDGLKEEYAHRWEPKPDGSRHSNRRFRDHGSDIVGG